MNSTDLEDIVENGIHLYWCLAICAALTAVLPSVPFPASFRNAVVLSACRGKLTDKAPSRALGPLSDCFVPQSWFSHFYAIGCVSNLFILVNIAVLIWAGKCNCPECGPVDPTLSSLAILFFQFHLCRRLAETLYVMKYPKDAKMHVLAYLFGLSYYVVVPLTLLDSTLLRHVLTVVPEELPAMFHKTSSHAVAGFDVVALIRKLSIIQILGYITFIAGNVLQFQSHYLLSQLGRRARSRKYSIPRGGLFEYVSCPHYFAEILIYLGMAVSFFPFNNPKSIYPFIWVVVNLALAGKMTHAWYLENFKSYPKSRKALIPCVY